MKLSKYRFIIKPKRELILPPYKGSTFRGGFGHAFRHAVCIEQEKECPECSLRNKCVYSYVFETSVPQKQGNQQDKDVPHPFIIEPPIDERRHYGIDDRLDFDLILIGRAVDYMPYFIFAFEEVGRVGVGKNKGQYSLEKVISMNKDKETLIYDGKSHFRDDFNAIDSDEIINVGELPNSHRVKLRFLTPARIKYNGKFIDDTNFEVVIRNLLRRLSSLAEVHCGEKWELDWKGLIERTKEIKTVHSDLVWKDWERYSQRQDTKLKMGGFLGEITFEGDLAEFMPFLKLGEYLHIGKGTVFGLGKYEIVGE
ncbi:MAG: CRISPR system precrRNA processing endoribonuclease RAMP protein Cas6 [Methanosarcinales archaeon]|nr:MAG: CRISPR system precrRNA processing endoribonuclease RAMP protein Cas6 [Methanosarcinales archaeon]